MNYTKYIFDILHYRNKVLLWFTDIIKYDRRNMITIETKKEIKWDKIIKRTKIKNMIETDSLMAGSSNKVF